MKLPEFFQSSVGRSSGFRELVEMSKRVYGNRER